MRVRGNMKFNNLQLRRNYLQGGFKPRILVPEDGEQEVYEDTVFQTNSFRQARGVGEHAYTIWHIATNESFTEMVFNSGMDTTHLTEIPLTETGIVMDTTYYMRVLFASNAEESEWSDVVSFTTYLFESEIDAWSDGIYESSQL